MDIEQEARELGHLPKEQFRGDPDKWVDAETFVERGKHIMPILKKNNEKLLGTVGQLQAEVGSLKQSIASMTESTKELIAFHEESTKAQVAKARETLLAEIKAARVDENVDAEVAAVGKLSEFDAAQKAVAKAEAPSTSTPTPTPEPVSPEVAAWMAENPWYGSDEIRTGMALGVAKQLRKNGDARMGSEFLAAVAEIVEDKLGEGDKSPASPASKVESNRGSGGGRSGRQDYASLPPDARAYCDKQAEKFVGPSKVFKTAKDWQAHYATEYYKAN